MVSGRSAPLTAGAGVSQWGGGDEDSRGLADLTAQALQEGTARGALGDLHGAAMADEQGGEAFHPLDVLTPIDLIKSPAPGCPSVAAGPWYLPAAWQRR